ncbi:hypothetical protein [Sandarakinorhabdus sp.]|uniref:hypothetical protein n=1 Tax=Sandarakinorhabdus sp. TaxID=1916663 RepID=UPI00286DD0E4|nr:hypothetical protein [Sandarakinorhabdus sp.]
MGLALIAVVAIAWWLHQKGQLLPNLLRYGGLAAAGLLALRFLSTGRIVPAALVAAGGWAWWLWNERDGTATSELAQAAQLLGVAANAPSETIWQAWRQAMTSAHPDAGGSAEAAQALTAARDLLIMAAEKHRRKTPGE